jgi:hypothetical protein
VRRLATANGRAQRVHRRPACPAEATKKQQQIKALSKSEEIAATGAATPAALLLPASLLAARQRRSTARRKDAVLVLAAIFSLMTRKKGLSVKRSVELKKNPNAKRQFCHLRCVLRPLCRSLKMLRLLTSSCSALRFI